MILIIDNYDSFTYNLLHYLGEVSEGQLSIQVYRNDAISPEQVEELRPSHLVLSPGPGTPAEAPLNEQLIRRFHGRLPLLGVCLGHQALGAAFGGNVVRGPVPVHGKVSAVYHSGGSIFRGLPSPFQATRYHSLVVERETLPEALAIRAWTEDNQIMGLVHRDTELTVGVQFHPESIMTKCGHALLKNFLTLAN